MSAVKERVKAPVKTPAKTPAKAVAKSQPQPLPTSLRSRLENSFGTNLSNVNLHTDHHAGNLASSLEARAFTHGSDIYFGHGEFNPQTTSGQLLVAHEVAHTIQQRNVPATQTLSLAGPSASPFETEADSAARTALSGGVLTKPLTVVPTALHGTILRRMRKESHPVEEVSEEIQREVQNDPEQASGSAAEILNRVSPSVRDAVLLKHSEDLPQAVKTELPEATASANPVPEVKTETPTAVAQTQAKQAPTPKPAQQTKPEPAVTTEPEKPEPPAPEVASDTPTDTGDQPAANGDLPTPSPEEDPNFKKVKQRVGGAATTQKANPGGPAAAAAAQSAAVSPTSEVDSQAAAGHVEKLSEKPTNPFDREAFKKDLKAKIQSVMPKNLEQADEFKEKDNVGKLKGDLQSTVNKEKDTAAGGIPEANKEKPSTDGIKPREAETLTPTPVGPPPASVSASQAIPPKRPDEQVSLDTGPRQVEDQMSQAGVTDKQLRSSNEPTFTAAADAKQAAAEQSQTAPQQFRAEENQLLGGAKQGAEQEAVAALTGMHGKRDASLAKALGEQKGTKTTDEQKRVEIAAEIQRRFEDTKTKVTDRLAKLETDAGTFFDKGAETARTNFETYVDKKFTAWKDDRYGGVGGGALWLKDKLFDLPDEVNQFYEDGKANYLIEMDGVIDQVATIVETGLTEAKQLINDGKKSIQEYVKNLPQELQKIGDEAAKDIQSQFDELDQQVNESRQRLVDGLAQKYADSMQQVNDRIKEMRAANKGLVSRAMDAVKEVINTIIEIKNMLLSTLAKAANAIDLIIADPIGFLGNLVAGVKQGFLNFIDNIGKHLKAALLNWLFGELANAGIQIPDNFDLKGILSLVLQVLGLTYQNIRARAVNIVGEKVVGALETAAEIFQVIRTEGLGGIWRLIQEKVEDLRTTVVEQVKTFVMEKVIMAGVTWIIGLLNPASAFIKACKAIYDIVMFFIERGKQIMELVNAVIDSVTAIAQGNISVAANFVENALAKALPVVIGFLASLLGVGGLSEKIKSIIEKIRKPINAAIDWVINKAVGLVKAAGKLFGIGKEKPADKKKTELSPVKEAARVQVAQRVSGEHTPAQINVILGQILTELKPQGLHSLRLGEVTESGAHQVLASASPEEPIEDLWGQKKQCLLRVKLGVVPGTQATVGTGLGSKKDARKDSPTAGQEGTAIAPNLPPIQGNVGPARQPIEDFRQTLLQARYKTPGKSISTQDYQAAEQKAISQLSRMGKNPSPAYLATIASETMTRSVGGAVFNATPANPEVRLETYNVTEMKESDKSSSHHAEAQFENWCSTQPATFWARVKKIDLDINLSPCRGCTQTLLRVKKAHFPSIVPTLTFGSMWDKNKKLGTRASDIAALQGPYTVVGPTKVEEDKLVTTP